MSSQYQSETKSSMSGFSLPELLIVMTVLVIILGVLSGIVGSVQQSYSQQRPQIEAINSANTGMDAIARLIRMGNRTASTGTPTTGIDPCTVDGDGAGHVIHIRSNWNPFDSNTTETDEDIKFSVSNGTLQIEENTGAFWDSSTTYAVGAVVTRFCSKYVATQAHADAPPESNPAKWTLQTPAPTAYLEGINSVTFTYYSVSNVQITDPVANDSRIALVKIDLQTSGTSPMTFTTSAYIR